MQMKPYYLFPFILVCYEIAIYFSNDMYLPALPNIMNELALTVSQVQFTLTIWFIGAACMPLIIGIVSERFGRRETLLIGGVIYIFATVLCATTNNYHMLLLARLLEGAVMASMIVPGYAIIHELYTQKEAIRILALMGSITIIAPALGPLLGSGILLLTNWRGIFWLIAILAFIPLTILFYVMPKSMKDEKKHHLTIKNLFRQYGRVLARPQFVLLMCTLGFIFSGWIAWISAAPLLLIETYHFTEIEYGLIQAIIFLVYILGNLFVKYLISRFSLQFIIKMGMILLVLSSIWMLCFSYLFFSLWALIIGMSLFALGSGISFAPFNRQIIESSQEVMGIRMALFSVFLTSFCVLGSGVISIYFDGRMITLSHVIGFAILMSLLIYILYCLVMRYMKN